MNRHVLPLQTISDNEIPDTLIGYVSVQVPSPSLAETSSTCIRRSKHTTPKKVIGSQ
jgi:hypothetical protein